MLANKRKMFIEVMRIAEEAKSVGYYALPNVAFAILLNEYTGLKGEDRSPGDEPPVAWLNLESLDTCGKDILAPHLDILAVETAERCPDGWRLHSLSIPVPMLSISAVTTALKSASVSHRLVHYREVREPFGGEITELWGKFREILRSNGMCGTIAKNVLSRHSYNAIINEGYNLDTMLKTGVEKTLVVGSLAEKEFDEAMDIIRVAELDDGLLALNYREDNAKQIAIVFYMDEHGTVAQIFTSEDGSALFVGENEFIKISSRLGMKEVGIVITALEAKGLVCHV